MSQDLKEKSLNLITEFVKKKDYKSKDFLYSITIYLKNNPNEIRNYFKFIKKAILQLEKEFDNTYLLLFEEKYSKKVFTYEKNKIFLIYVDELIYILTNNDYIKESDKLTQLKSKLELGFERYFRHNSLTLFQFSTHDFSHSFKETLDKEISVSVRLIDIFELKLEKSKDFKKEFDKLKQFLSEFPKEIYTKKTKYLLDVYNSLFPNERLDIKEFKSEIIIKDMQNITTANLVFEILE